MKKCRTDLALEIRESYEEDDVEISGVSLKEERGRNKESKITTVEIMNEDGAEAMGKPQGVYITMEYPKLLEEDEDYREDAERDLESRLQKIVKDKPKNSILIIGLGNREITADALGPMVVDELLITRHYFREFGENFGEKHGYRKISALVPGVMAQTGMEAMETIRGVVTETKPDLVIAIDALASRSVSRLNTTIQLTDTGICPGAGIGNNRQALNEESLGCPVIAIGVPTVVDAGTIVLEGIDAFVKEHPELKKEGEKLLENGFSNSIRNLFVTPKNIDGSIRYVSDTVAGGINRFIKKKSGAHV